MTASRQENLYQYILTIKSTGNFRINLLSFLLCFISFTFFAFWGFITESKTILYISATIPITILAVVFIQSKNPNTGYRFPILATSIGWLWIPGMQMMALAFAFFLFLDSHARKPEKIGISDERITINRLSTKHYSWSEINNIILKDNVLTLDFKNNKIMQKDVQAPDFDITEFNHFCTSQL